MDLRGLRKKKRLSQAELADLVGVHENTLRRWENGVHEPKASELKKICEVFGITESELLSGPAPQTWELRVVYKKTLEEDVIDLTGNASNAVVLLEDRAMSIKIDGPIELWSDDAKFEDLIDQLRKKREAGMKARKEGW